MRRRGRVGKRIIREGRVDASVDPATGGPETGKTRTVRGREYNYRSNRLKKIGYVALKKAFSHLKRKSGGRFHRILDMKPNRLRRDIKSLGRTPFKWRKFLR